MEIDYQKSDKYNFTVIVRNVNHLRIHPKTTVNSKGIFTEDNIREISANCHPNIRR